MSCNRRNFLVSILILTFALTLGRLNSAFSQTANEYFQQGKADLANNSLSAAHANFQQALALDPNHEGANFFHALTNILMISNSSAFNSLLDRAGVSASGRNIFEWNADFARDAYGNIILPADAPTGEDLQVFARNTLLPVIVEAISSLGKVGSGFLTYYNWALETGTGTPSGPNRFTTQTQYWYTNEWVGYKVIINGSEYDITSNTSNVLTLNRNLGVSTGYYEYKIVAPIEIDYGDALAFRGGLILARAGLLIFLAYNLNVDIDAIVPLVDTAAFDVQTDLIQTYPQLLTLLPTNRMGEAKASVRESITQLSAAADAILAETDPQGNDFFILNPKDGAAFSKALAEWKNALDGPVFIKDLNTQVDLAQFFDNPKNLRDYLPTFSGTLINRGSFPDPTLGGVFPAMTATELCRLVEQTFRMDPFIDVAPDYWAYSYIAVIYYAHITNGCACGIFCPDTIVTREQMAAFIIRSIEGDRPSSYCSSGSPYTDVSAADNQCGNIKRLYERGLTKVVGQFNPKGLVTRGQMAAFVIRALYGENFFYTLTPYYVDVPSNHGFFKYVQKMKDTGLTKTSGTYFVDRNITRAEVAAFLGRAFIGMQ